MIILEPSLILLKIKVLIFTNRKIHNNILTIYQKTLQEEHRKHKDLQLMN